MTKFTVHETAVVDHGASIGAGTRIWHWSHISASASISENVVIGQNVYIGNNVKVGKNCKIQNNVSVFDGVTLESDVFCGPSAVFTNVINPRAAVERKSEYKKTLVQKGATLGANATIVCGTTIGRYAFVGAGSVVTKNIPDHGLFVGNPARQIGWISRSGERLELPINGPASAYCRATGEKYLLCDNNLCRLDQT